MTYCEDFPCCGHTPQDPCERQWYDEPDAFNPRVNPHCFCEHEFGICDVWEDDECDDPEHECVDCERNGFGTPWHCSYCDRPCPEGAHVEVPA